MGTQGGRQRLWLLCALALLALLLVALVLSAAYPVPSTWRVVYYALAFVGPSILFTTGALTVASTFVRALSVQLVPPQARPSSQRAPHFVMAVYVPAVW